MIFQELQLNIPKFAVFFFSYFIQSWVFSSVAYFTVANSARHEISIHCQVSIRSQYLFRLLSQCWITGGHTIHPLIEGILPPNWYRTHTVPKFGLQSSSITGVCHYTRLATVSFDPPRCCLVLVAYNKKNSPCFFFLFNIKIIHPQ